MFNRVTCLVDEHGIGLDQQHDGQRTQRAGQYSTDGFLESDDTSRFNLLLLLLSFSYKKNVVRHKTKH